MESNLFLKKTSSPNTSVTTMEPATLHPTARPPETITQWTRQSAPKPPSTATSHDWQRRNQWTDRYPLPTRSVVDVVEWLEIMEMDLILCGRPASIVIMLSSGDILYMDAVRKEEAMKQRWSRAAIIPVHDERTMIPLCNIDDYILISFFIFSWHKFSHFGLSFLIIYRDSHFLFVHVSDIKRLDFTS